MPKLEHDEEEFDPKEHSLSETAKTSIATKLGTGGSTAPSTTSNPFSTGQSTFNTSSGSNQFGTPNTFNAGGGFAGGTGSFGGNGSIGFGNSNAQQQPAGVAAGGTTTLETDKGFGDFINSKWRPLMAVIYMITCTTDFVLFPVLWSVLQAMSHGQVTSQWQPLTLQGAGLYHIAMGAVLGLAAYGRSQEKIAGKA
jgi:hypothetical protein